MVTYLAFSDLLWDSCVWLFGHWRFYVCMSFLEVMFLMTIVSLPALCHQTEKISKIRFEWPHWFGSIGTSIK